MQRTRMKAKGKRKNLLKRIYREREKCGHKKPLQNSMKLYLRLWDEPLREKPQKLSKGTVVCTTIKRTKLTTGNNERKR